jgi:mRNA interferase RelE/StbE
MAWPIELDPTAKRELKQLDPQVARRITGFLFARVAALDNPRSIGEALKGTELGDLWKYRVGDYRQHRRQAGSHPGCAHRQSARSISLAFSPRMQGATYLRMSAEL